MSNKAPKKSVKLDKEEQALLDSYDNGEWKPAKNIKKEKTVAKKMAHNTLLKDARVNIRISNDDLLRIKQKAAYEGLPYQTLMASVLHKYASGH